ncbi:MAG: cystathionine gamma-synthase [Candidatus Aminicenantes bacterium RBG_16_63_16]|nr:MAG: cystathionine gamma-synthase [Candidatus Aminicenantes bacterium RBG_16_63_16]
MTKNNRGFGTRAVHAGEGVRPADYVPVATPIHPTVGFVYDSMDELDAIFATTRPGYVYPRYGSPTVAALEEAVANLEGGEAAFGFSSGMAAIHVALLAAGVRAGTAIVAAQDLYGATTTLIERLLAGLGVKARFVDMADLAAVEAALSETRPAAFVAEIISNPLLKVADVPALAELAHRYGAQCLIDNTFATPYLFTPLACGADYVIHSATKYIGGHGDVMAGVVVTSAENRRKLYEANKLIGSVLGPFEAWLALRGLKTLPLRMQKQCANAKVVAEWLAARPGIGCVNYPGLPSHPQHAVARRLFGDRGFGAMVSFEIAGADGVKVFRFMEALELCLPATTLGDVYTLVLHPATTSHRSLTPEERDRVGISDGLARLSVGIEDVEDILADLDQALRSP